MDTRVFVGSQAGNKARHRRRTSTVQLNSFRQEGLQRANSPLTRGRRIGWESGLSDTISHGRSLLEAKPSPRILELAADRAAARLIYNVRRRVLAMIFHLLQLGLELAQTRPQAVHLVLMVWSAAVAVQEREIVANTDRKSTRLNSSHDQISYAVFCLKKKKKTKKKYNNRKKKKKYTQEV